MVMNMPLSQEMGWPLVMGGPLLMGGLLLMGGPLLMGGLLVDGWAPVLEMVGMCKLSRGGSEELGPCNAIWPGIRQSCLAKKRGEGVGGGGGGVLYFPLKKKIIFL